MGLDVVERNHGPRLGIAVRVDEGRRATGGMSGGMLLLIAGDVKGW
jgi:hypothetical protein